MLRKMRCPKWRHKIFLFLSPFLSKSLVALLCAIVLYWWLSYAVFSPANAVFPFFSVNCINVFKFAIFLLRSSINRSMFFLSSSNTTNKMLMPFGRFVDIFNSWCLVVWWLSKIIYLSGGVYLQSYLRLAAVRKRRRQSGGRWRGCPVRAFLEQRERGKGQFFEILCGQPGCLLCTTPYRFVPSSPMILR